MRVMIFGASGFIGRAVTRVAAERGHEVVGLARSEDAGAVIRRAGGQVLRGDLLAPETWRPALEKADAVIQLAASFGPGAAAAEEPLIAAILARQGSPAQAPRVVYTGGCWLYPERVDPPIDEETAFDPLPPFAYMVKNRARLLAAGVDLVTVHPGIVWSEAGGPFGDWLRDLEAGRPVHVVGSPEVLWPLVHVDDLAELYALALERGRTGSDLLGVTDPAVSVRSMIHHAAAMSGRPFSIATIPLDKAVAEGGDGVAGEARSQCVRTIRARTELGWRPLRPFPASQ